MAVQNRNLTLQKNTKQIIMRLCVSRKSSMTDIFKASLLPFPCFKLFTSPSRRKVNERRVGLFIVWTGLAFTRRSHLLIKQDRSYFVCVVFFFEDLLKLATKA